MKRITIIVPCFNEEENIGRLCQKITEITLQQPQYSWKTLFVDDGSTDGTIDKIIAEREKNGMFSLIALSRNFGKEQAILAGLDNVSCDCAIIMDADLQHPVSAIPLMIEQWEKGFDDVYAKRLYRGKESWIRRNTKVYQRSVLLDRIQEKGNNNKSGRPNGRKVFLQLHQTPKSRYRGHNIIHNHTAENVNNLRTYLLSQRIHLHDICLHQDHILR